ncbi:thioesterase-like superfamily-domain-containing protein [Aspergillus ambiguus]|uniref:thioesterase-like superfamily-domain-containing protein n=1 Tax=Aspergillus ambiguus TaxID=176160 RepID=UPI003CCDDFCB
MPSKHKDTDSDGDELHHAISFVDLMSLKQLDSPAHANANPDEPEKVERFQSLAQPFPPGEGERAFGGHVYAQSAYAASKTVPKGFVIHDMTGSFILPGRIDVPYIFTVRHLRDGNAYCSRAVDVRQAGKICFASLCSFKRDEKQKSFGHQPMSAQERYRSILGGTRPEDQPRSPSVDVDWWIEAIQQGNFSEREFPGLDVRKVDMKGFNLTADVQQNPVKYRQLTQYSLKGSPDSDSTLSREELKRRDQSGEYDNLYACAHMYSSDKNSLLLIPRALGHTAWTAMASLSITVVFHEHGDALRMVNWDETTAQGEAEPSKKWFIQEAWSPRSGENRVIHESWLWSPDGRLMATSYQDVLLVSGDFHLESSQSTQAHHIAFVVMAVEVVPLTEADIPGAIEVIQQAFADDPYFKWVFDSSQFNKQRNYDSLAARCLWGINNALFYVAKETASSSLKGDRSSRVVGVSCWLPPHPSAEPESWYSWIQGWVLSFRQGLNNLRHRGRGGLNSRRYWIWKERQHEAQSAIWDDPRGYYFCNIVAVSPAAQGGGIGRKLFEIVSDRAGKEGMKCYLESSRNVPNVQIYEKMGYTMKREMECRDGDDLYCMVREPKSKI